VAKTPKKAARPALHADRLPVRRKPKAGTSHRSARDPQTFAQFQRLLEETDDLMADCIHGRRWTELEAALPVYAGRLGMDAPFLLFLTLYGWSLRSNMTLAQAIKLLRDWDPRRDGDGTGNSGSRSDPRAEALAVFARLESAGQPLT
jgi:hypothetical protein